MKFIPQFFCLQVALNWLQIIGITKPGDFWLTLWIFLRVIMFVKFFITIFYRFRRETFFVGWTRRSCTRIIWGRSRCPWSTLSFGITTLLHIHIHIVIAFRKAINWQWTLWGISWLRLIRNEKKIFQLFALLKNHILHESVTK